MANLNDLPECELPANERQRRELIRKVHEVAIEIEFAGAKDTRILARVLDNRKIRPLNLGYVGPFRVRHKTWIVKHRYGKNSSAGKLHQFLKKYLPDLYLHGVTENSEKISEAAMSASLLVSFPDRELKENFAEACKKQERDMSCTVRHLIASFLEEEEKKAVSIGGVRQKAGPRKEGLNINGWTIRQDMKGFYRAYRRFNGKLKSVYLGKTLDGAEQKLQYVRSD
jgi:hypothetical protein